MAQPVNVRSIAALTDFRAAFATLGEAAQRSLDEADMEIRRALQWITVEQPAFWKSEHQRAMDQVTERRNELEQCQNRTLDGQRPACYQERKALEAAKQRVRYVHEKIEVVQKWGRTLQQEVSEYQVQVAKFRGMLEGEVPRSLALLGRMVAALESYAQMPVMSAPGKPKQTGSAARPSGGAQPKKKSSIFHQLREHTPDLETRENVDLIIASGDEEEAGAQNIPDHDDSQQSALETAFDLQLEPDFPDWEEKIVIIAGCLKQEQVYLERIAAPENDSGWFIGLVEPKLGVTPQYEGITMSELMRRRPELMRAIGLPEGYLAVFSNDEIVAIVNEKGIDLWQARSEDPADDEEEDE